MRQFLKAGLLAAAGILGAGDAFGQDADAPLKVCFVYVGPAGDYGWSYQHDQGRLAVAEHFGDKVETQFVENVAEGADAERVIRNLASGGCGVIFTTSFGFMNATAQVAEEFPDVVFEHATGYKRADNLGTYLSVTYQGRYVTGFLAGEVTETGKIGYIASFPIPEVIRDINAVRLGLDRSNPDATLNVIWLNTWYDPGREADAARAFIDQGVDVLVQHTDSPAAMQVAQESGVYAVGQASDMSRFGPDAQLTAVIDDWSPYYIRVVQEVMDGTWEPEDFWGGIAEGVIVMAPWNKNVPAEAAAEADAIVAGIADGSIHPFAGPIRDQAGEVMVPEGTTLTNEELSRMNTYVYGVEGTIPQ